MNFVKFPAKLYLGEDLKQMAVEWVHLLNRWNSQESEFQSQEDGSPEPAIRLIKKLFNLTEDDLK